MVPLGRRGCVPSYFELEAIKEEIARYKSENDLN
jgi:predicted NBD/HSP70 family sugar kinase